MYAHAVTSLECERSNVTDASPDLGVTEPRTAQPLGSSSHDQDWEDMISTCLQDSNAQTATCNMDFELFNLADFETSFNNVGSVSGQDPIAMTMNSSLSSSVADPIGAIEPYHIWQASSDTHAMKFAQQQSHPLESYDLGPWTPDPQLNHSLSFSTFDSQNGLGINMPVTSHPVDISRPTQSSQVLRDPNSLGVDYGSAHSHSWNQHESNNFYEQNTANDDEEDRGSTDSTDPCYAQLLYQCLRGAPNHTLSLRELYDWVAQHSQKAKDPKNRGWQNSVRHNLSMNAAFVRVPTATIPGPKKGSLWQLTQNALREGVISTTRYRKDPKRRPERRAAPALNRQASGAKGGRATRDASRFRQQQHHKTLDAFAHSNRVRRSHRYPHSMHHSPYTYSAETSPQPGAIPPTPAASPYFIDHAASLTLPLSPAQTPSGQHLMSATPPSGFRMNFEHRYYKPSGFTAFDFLPLDYSQAGIFGNHDPELQRHPYTPTPSLMTEGSFMTDDNDFTAATLMPCDLPHDTNVFQ